jgi:hypothetical protein
MFANSCSEHNARSYRRHCARTLVIKSQKICLHISRKEFPHRDLSTALRSVEKHFQEGTAADFSIACEAVKPATGLRDRPAVSHISRKTSEMWGTRRLWRGESQKRVHLSSRPERSAVERSLCGDSFWKCLWDEEEATTEAQERYPEWALHPIPGACSTHRNGAHAADNRQWPRAYEYRENPARSVLSRKFRNTPFATTKN